MTRAFDKAYRAVRDGVIAGRFPPAQRITEQEVAEAAGVSRTPVREALRRLHAEGIVDFRPNQGAMVTAWSADDTEEFFELRTLLECHAARRAAERATPAQLEVLRSLAERQQAEVQARAEGYLQRVGEIDRQFHRALQDAAGSTRLTHALVSILEGPLALRTFEKCSAEELARTASHHLEIVRALECRDAEWAAAVTRADVLAARRAQRA